MPKIGTDEVLHLAKLAKIGLTPEEAESMAVELERIVEFVEQLQEVKTENLPATNQVTGLSDVWREDEVVSSQVTRQELLKNAPSTEEGYIKVKRVLE
jgi:aspartyl-tRNA(Asn)/glutamyl-tRNA(Gln) amidotransferase subunit C